MLVVDISINDTRTIGEIHIQRLHSLDEAEDGMCSYKIRFPEGSWCQKTIKHKYSEGWFPLLEKVVNILKEEGFQTNHE